MQKQNRFNRRDALKGLAIGGVSLLSVGATQADATTKLSAPASHKKVKIVIVGAGSGGMMSAARLRRSAPNAEIVIVAPNKTHLYQSGQTFVAFDLYQQFENERTTAELLPDNVKWLEEYVTSFHPQNNTIQTSKSGTLSYDFLVVALGVEYDYESIEGLDASMIGKNGIASVYFNDTRVGDAQGGEITKSWLREIKRATSKGSVNVLCTEPETPIKGVGTSLDILFLANDRFKNENIKFSLAQPTKRLLPSEHFHPIIAKQMKKSKNITPLYSHTLTALDAKNKKATFVKDGKKVVLSYDFIHVVPPMRPAKVLQNSSLAIQAGKHKGYLDIDAKTLQHKKYKNVFGVGDILGIELGKTGGSAQKQAVVLQDNIAAAIEKKKLPALYDGYTVAPVKTEFGKIILAEFNEKGPLPTFWLNPDKPRWIWWEMDLHVVKTAYFSLMMRGMM